MPRMFLAIVALTAAAFLPTGAIGAQPGVQTKFEPAAGKAVIFIVRQPMKGDTVQAGVEVDGINISMNPGTHYRWEVAPGTHKVTTGITASPDTVTIQAQPGQTYFVRYTVIGHQSANAKNLTLVEAQEGRELVAQTKAVRKVVGAPAAGG